MSTCIQPLGGYGTLSLQHRRQYSSILAQYPWQSTSIVQAPERIDVFSLEIPGYKRFINTLHNFETQLFRGATLSLYQILNLLGIHFDSEGLQQGHLNIVSKHADALSAAEFHEISSIITAYRLFESIALRSKLIQPSPLRSVSAEPLYLPPSRTKLQDQLHGWKKMSNWVDILFDFRATMSKLSAENSAGLHFGSTHSLVNLLRLVTDTGSKNAYHAIESNFLHAALHLNVMKNVAFQNDQVPDLPKDIHRARYPIFFDQELVSEICSKDLTPDDEATTETALDEFCKTMGVDASGVLMLRVALQLALLISPIYLLLAFQLVKKSFHRRTLLEYAAKLGTNKPKLLVDAENHILDALETLSKGRTTPRNVFDELLQSLPWPELEKALDDPLLSGWFAHQINGPSGSTMTFGSVIKNVSCHSHEEHVLSPPEKEPFDQSSDSTHSCGPNNEVRNPLGGPNIDLPSRSVSPSTNNATLEFPGQPEQDTALQGTIPDISVLLASSPTSMQDGMPSAATLEHTLATIGPTSLDLPHGSAFPVIDPNDIFQDFNMEYPNPNEESDLELSELTQFSDEDGSLKRPRDETSESDVDPTLDSHPSLPTPPEAGNGKAAALPTDSDRAPGSGKATNGKASKDSSNSTRPKNPSGAKGSKKRKTKVPAKSSAGKGPKNSSGGRGSKPSNTTSAPNLSLAGIGNTKGQPIDVDQYSSLFEPVVVREFMKAEEISLPNTPAPRRFQSRETYTIYAADGTSKTLQLAAHQRGYLIRFKKFMEKAKKSLIEGKPRFIKAPEQSLFSVRSYEIFTELPGPEKQKLISRRCLVVQGWPCDPKLRFNAEGLFRLAGSLDRQISIHDTSQQTNTNVCCSTVVSGTVQDLLDNATPTGKILNALDFSMFRGDLTDEEYATDVIAWTVTRGRLRVDSEAMYPIHHTNWGLAGHQHCFTFVHVDAEGFLTRNLIEDGGKAWGVLGEVRHPDPKKSLPHKLSSIHFFLDPRFKTTTMDPEDGAFEVEIIYLKRGDMLFMPPGTPHFVITTDHSICLGGHFYGTGSMQHTLQGLVHTFALNDFLTNTEHPPSRSLLRRIVLFYYQGLIKGDAFPFGPAATHLPDIHDIDGVLNLLSACVLVVLGNVLDFRTYRAPTQKNDINAKPTQEERVLVENLDHNAIPYEERVSACFARGVALHLMDWIRSCCTVESQTGGVLQDLPSYFFVQIANSLLKYRDLVDRAELRGVPGCTKELLERQVMATVNCHSRLRAMWLKKDRIPSNSLEFLGKSDYRVKWQTGWQSVWRSEQVDFFGDGRTALDDKFFSAQVERKSVEQGAVLPHLSAAFDGQRVAKRPRLKF